jgi:hypothetical protein
MSKAGKAFEQSILDAENLLGHFSLLRYRSTSKTTPKDSASCPLSAGRTAIAACFSVRETRD